MRRQEVHISLKSALLVLFCFVFGVLTGVLGVGPWFLGGLVLAYLFGFTPSMSRSLVMILILSAAVPAIVVYAAKGNLHWLSAVECALGAFLGAFVSAAAFRRRFVPVVRKVLAVILIASALVIIALSRHAEPGTAFHVTLGAAFAAGVGAGFVGALAAVATGTILIPILVLALGAPQVSAQALAIAAIIPASIPLVASQYAAGGIDRTGLFEYILAAAVGGVLGAGIASTLSPMALAIVFGSFLILNSAAVFSRTPV